MQIAYYYYMVSQNPAFCLVDLGFVKKILTRLWSVFFRIRTGIPNVVVLTGESFETVCLVNRIEIMFHPKIITLRKLKNFLRQGKIS